MNNTQKIINFSVLIVSLSVFYYLVIFLPTNAKIQKKNLTKIEKYNNLSHLAITVQVDYLKKYIGDPVVINYYENKKEKEYIFIDPDYYIQVITDSYDKVLLFTITTRKGDFNPTFKIRSLIIQLGKTTYYNQGRKPSNCYSFAGNTAPSYYYEEYMGDNLTSYQNYSLGYNDAGYGDGVIIEATQPTEADLENERIVSDNGNYNCKLPSDEIRNKYTINTLGVSKYATLSAGVNRRLMELIPD